MKRTAVVAFLILGGCMTADIPATPMASTFAQSDVAWFSKPGTGTISGNAVLRTVGGDAKTCAAQQVNLIPDSAYARERMARMFAAVDGPGYMSGDAVPKLPAADQSYANSTLRNVCDSQGNFSFDHLPPGKYYVTAEVTWGIPTQYFTRREGGLLMQPVVLADGESKRVILSR